MNNKEIHELIKLVSKSNLTEFKMKNGDFEVSIRTKKYSKESTGAKMIAAPQIMPVGSSYAPVAPAATETPATPAPVAKKEESSDTPDTSNLVEIKSPIVGTFYRSASPDKPPYVKIGDSVTPDSIVCIVEAMKLFNEIESEVTGKIVKVMVEDASPVEYDQVLYLVDPKG